jgi:predicted phage-related endonuclease
MALTAEQHAKRADKIGASFAPMLMAGDSDAIRSEWQRLVGDPSYEPKDLSNVWPVQFGSYIEPFALDWEERKNGHALTRRGEHVTHPKLPYLGCTLDAYREHDSTVIDCKAPGAHRKLDDVVAHYTPQMIVQRSCLQADHAALLIVHGGAEPREYPIEIDPDYEKLVFERLKDFWWHVENLICPVEMPAVAAPVVAAKIYQMDDKPDWKAQAERWHQAVGAAQIAKEAEKALKLMCPPDAVKCIGAGVVITRDRAGRLSLREAK